MAAGDLYQLTAAGAVVASLSSALIMGEGLAVAVGALTVSDFALLGSASIVTGAVAAIGAALTRPEMVQSLCLLIATLQTLWCLFPQTRRQTVSATGEEVFYYTPLLVIAALYFLNPCDHPHERSDATGCAFYLACTGNWCSRKTPMAYCLVHITWSARLQSLLRHSRVALSSNATMVQGCGYHRNPIDACGIHKRV